MRSHHRFSSLVWIALRRLKSFGGFAALLGAAAIVSGQDRRPEATFRIEAGLLQVEVRVTHRNGQPVSDLQRTDFSLTENGLPQEIATFEYIGQKSGAGRLEPNSPEREPNHSRASDSPDRLRIYIVTDLAPPTPTCVNTWEHELFFRGVRRFLEQTWQPGTEVSFNGTPFTTDRSKLTDLLAMMRRYPNGRSSPDKADWVPAVITPHGILQQAFECDEWEVRDRTARPSPELFTQMGRLSLERYIGLTRKLGRIEGKKVVVLFARGLLAGGRENAFVLERLAREALQARVAFYSVIPTALLAPHARLARQGSDLRITQGLFAVAENTGGKAIHSTNDFSEVFEQIYKDNSNYYLIGYYPKSRSSEGRFHQIAVTVNRPNLRIQSPKGYHEPKAFGDLTAEERRTLLEYQVLGDESYSDLPLHANLEYFRDEHNKPTLLFNVAVAAGALPVETSKGRVTIGLKVAASAGPTVAIEPPLIVEQTVRLQMDAQKFEKLRADPKATIQFPFRMPVSAGAHRWKAVVRDEQSGVVGSFQSRIEVPAFQEQTTPSSLMLTTRMVDHSTESGDDRTAKSDHTEEPPGLDIGAFSFYPQATNTFLRGEHIYVVYELYNTSQEILQSPPAPRVFLLSGEAPGKPVDQPPFQSYQAFPSKRLNAVSYIATLDTDTLAPGEYTLVLGVPNSENGIFKKFVLEPR